VLKSVKKEGNKLKMENLNICKFNFNQSSDLVCHNFIYESTDCQSVSRTAENHIINLVTKGKGRLLCGGKEYIIERGALYCILKGENFSVENISELEYSYICFSGRRASEYMERLGISESNRLFSGNEEIIPFWTENIASVSDGNLDLLSEATLLYSLAKLNPCVKNKGSDVISKVIALTEEKFTDPDTSLGSIADELGYHSKYISFLFKKQKGITYTKYLRDIRIKHAMFLIEQGIVSVKNVAILSGFQDALYFSKVFKDAVGISPKEYIDSIHR